MLNNLISNARKYWPMHIVEGSNKIGFRIGGCPPVGIKPNVVHKFTQYFGTFPIMGNQEDEMSIFCSFDYLHPDSAWFITRNTQKLLGEDSKVIQCVFHESSKRAEESNLFSELKGYIVSVGAESLDDEEDETCGVAHKIGGIPFLRNYRQDVRKISDHLLISGYVHFLQWAYPGKGDCVVKGAWPFHDYMFHLYLKKVNEGYRYQALLV